jgi:hypothetical protein
MNQKNHSDLKYFAYYFDCDGDYLSLIDRVLSIIIINLTSLKCETKRDVCDLCDARVCDVMGCDGIGACSSSFV